IPSLLCFFPKPKTAYEMIWCLEFRRVLFRSRADRRGSDLGRAPERTWAPVRRCQCGRNGGGAAGAGAAGGAAAVGAAPGAQRDAERKSEVEGERGAVGGPLADVCRSPRRTAC